MARPALAAAYEDPPSRSGPSVLQGLLFLNFASCCLLFLFFSTKTHSRSRLLLEAGSIFEHLFLLYYVFQEQESLRRSWSGLDVMSLMSLFLTNGCYITNFDTCIFGSVHRAQVLRRSGHSH